MAGKKVLPPLSRIGLKFFSWVPLSFDWSSIIWPISEAAVGHKNSKSNCPPPISFLIGDIIMSLSAQNETKGASFNWYVHQNKKAKSF